MTVGIGVGVGNDFVLPVSLLVSDQVVVSGEAVVADGALVGSVLWSQMG